MRRLRSAHFYYGEGINMKFVKIKLPPFLTNVEKEEPCLAAIYVNAQIVWSGRCNRLAVFEANETCQIGILVYDACVRFPFHYSQDVVITGIVSPEKQYEIIQVDWGFEFVETDTENP